MAKTGGKGLKPELSDRLREIILEMKTQLGTQGAVANKLRISQAHISGLLSGSGKSGGKVLGAVLEYNEAFAARLFPNAVTVERREPETLEEFAISLGLDPSDRDVVEQLGTAYHDLRTRQQMAETVAAGLRARKAESKNKTVGTRPTIVDEGSLGSTKKKKR
jgi:hypothetical protein